MSVIGDQFRDQMPGRYPGISTWVGTPPINSPTRAEFDKLKKEMAELKKLLKAAKRFDEATGQAECEEEDKIALLRRVAKLVGVDLSDVFPQPVPSA